MKLFPSVSKSPGYRAKPYGNALFSAAMGLSLMIGSTVALGSVEGSLMAIQTKLINVILPLVGILGLVFAAFSFFTGSPNARSHLILAIFGAVIGFGSPSIIAFIQGLVN